MSENPPPKGVVRYADELRSAIGIEPRVEHLKDALWRVTVQNARVVVTIDLEGPQGEWADSTLTIDGQPHELARSLLHLVQFFKDTDATLAKSDIKIVVPEEVDPTDAPPIVKHRLAKLRSRCQKVGVDVRLSRTERGGWCLGIYPSEKDCVEIYFSRVRGRWMQEPHQPFRLIIENEDISDEVETIEQALEMLFDVQAPATGGSSPVGRARGVQGKTNSVQVRNTTVIRN